MLSAPLLACAALAAVAGAGAGQDLGAPDAPGYPDLGRVSRLDDPALLGVTDDGPAGGRTGLPFLPFWIVMAYARDLEPGAVDWDAAPELDRAALEALLADGAPHRYRAFRIPRASLVSLAIEPAGPNPARIERYAAGWLKDPSWDGPVHFLAPYGDRPAEVHDLVGARGFFFKNLAYPGADGGERVAPAFVLAHLERVLEPERALFTALGIAAAASTAALCMLFLVLFARGSPRWAALKERLAWRRRARRLRHGAAGPGDP